jgi:Flp pilus assembly protein TadD
MRTSRPVLIPLLAAIVVAGCSQYEAFDSEAHLKEQLEKRLGEARARGVEIPYELNDEIRASVLERIDPSGSEKARTNRILDFVFSWLDLEYSLTPTRNAVDTYTTREGNCLSFVSLFVGVARSVRLNPFYVEVIDHQRWNYKNGVVVSQGHIVAGMRIDGQLSTFDFLPYTPKSYRNFNPIDDVMATAHFYNNLGAEALMRGELADAERYLTVAVELAPDFDKAVNNKGVLLLRQGDSEGALALYERALELDPVNVALLSNSARAYQQLGRLEDAGEVMSRIEETNQMSPYFFVYRGDLALAEGDLDRALEYMTKALRRDSEVPEVHVGLAEVFLAQGDVERARHHVQRALKLDATHKDARRLAVLLQAGGEPQG